MRSTRLYAVIALVCLAAGFTTLIYVAITGLPEGPLAAVLMLAGIAVAWQAVKRPARRFLLACLAAVLAIGALALLAVGGLWLDIALVAILFAAAGFATKRAFRLHVRLPVAARPAKPMLVWNPKSGGGKALSNNLEAEARKRGYEPIQLHPGDDLRALVYDAIERGADGLAAAGGDGTQAIVAGIAAEKNLPFACIPAGTRNHFALDLGVDRNDVIGALDAFVNGGERVVDLGYFNGQPFVNNVSIGLYAEAVQKPGYREAKLQTLFSTATDLMSDGGALQDIHFRDGNGNQRDSATVILVSNNVYRLGAKPASGTRPRMDEGILGITCVASPGDGNSSGVLPIDSWTARQFEISSTKPIAIGVDGEKLKIDPPINFTISPQALRVRIAPQHPGASPSSAMPDGVADAAHKLWKLATASAP